ncbi:P-II family nitrogen regulator [Almyronema epifaneia]|uniref:P-II family nitrogen regulator n=1 Tax=Almyronema epifaneia S1 TaxID=2991925 RepID=A0ABW6IIG1_9CYAN
MHPVKRIEIIASSMEQRKIVDCLEKCQVNGYSVIRDVTGRSDRGVVSDDFDLAGSTLSNIYIISFCGADQAKAVVAQLRPILNQYGGTCYLSDAMEIRSMNCVSTI